MPRITNPAGSGRATTAYRAMRTAMNGGKNDHTADPGLGQNKSNTFSCVNLINSPG